MGLRLSAFVALAIVTMGWLAAPASADPPLTREIRAASARVAAAPSSVELRLLRADLCRRAQRFDDALADLRLAEGLSPQEGRVHLLRAEVLFDAGRAADAAREIDAYLARARPGRNAFRAHVLAARIRVEDGEPEAALASYDAALAMGDEVQAHLERARLLERLGRIDEAADALATGVQALGGPAVLREALVQLELRRGRPAAALPHVDALMAHARVDTRWLLLRAEVHLAAGRADLARADRARALAEAERLLARRRSSLALLGRAEALVALGRHRQALRDLEEVQRRAPRLPRARALLHRIRLLLAGPASTNGSPGASP